MSLEIIRLRKRIESEPYSDELFHEALSLLDGTKGEVDTRNICEAMSPWGERLLEPARERIQAKRGIERYKALYLFFRSGVDVADEVEAAKSSERSKKLLREYDYAVRQIRAAASEKARPRVDPADSSVDPVLRFVELEKMSPEDFRALVGTKEYVFYHKHYALASLGFDREGTRALCEGSEWGLVFDGESLQLKTPDGKLRSRLPKGVDAERAALSEVKKQLKEAQATRHARLRDALISGDTWHVWLFRLLYLDHPLATNTTFGLVFEVGVGDGKAHVMTNAQGEWLDSALKAIDVDASSWIRIAHPSEMSDAEFKRWCAIAADEEWMPPFPQLAAERTPKALEDVLAALPEPFALTLVSKLASLGFEPSRVDGGIDCHSRRMSHDGLHVSLKHPGLPHRRSQIGRDKKAPIQGLSFYRGAKKISENKVPKRARVELIRMLETELS
ncbi:MAG: DUF4132 domain-containing protein [Polyangiales bacterium]